MNDDTKSSAKAFDVTPPTALNSQAATTAPKVIVKSDPMLTKAPSDSPSSSVVADHNPEEPVATEQPVVTVATAEKKVLPISEDVKPESQSPEDTKEENGDKQEETFVSTDAMPDTPSSNDLKNAEKSDTMQQPKIYDTNEYFVPIHETSHTHGFVKGSLIAGFIAAVLVLVAVAVLALNVNK